MTEKKRSVVIISVIVLVILIGLFFAFDSTRIHFRNPVVLLPQSQQFFTSDKGQQVQTNDDSYSLTNLKEISGGNVTNALSYEEALKSYQGRVMQFDANCRVAPVTTVVPVKSVVMLGNQSKWQRSVIVGPRTYSIAPYDYVLASFNSPSQNGITCDSVQDVGIISVQ